MNSFNKRFGMQDSSLRTLSAALIALVAVLVVGIALDAAACSSRAGEIGETTPPAPATASAGAAAESRTAAGTPQAATDEGVALSGADKLDALGTDGADQVARALSDWARERNAAVTSFEVTEAAASTSGATVRVKAMPDGTALTLTLGGADGGWTVDDGTGRTVASDASDGAWKPTPRAPEAQPESPAEPAR